MLEQMNLFGLMQQRSNFPCDNCVFDRNGRCEHIEDEDGWCVRGSFQVTPEQAVCPDCGRVMQVRQSDFDSDWAVCKCGTVKIFNNLGNRPSSMELWRQGRLIGK